MKLHFFLLFSFISFSLFSQIKFSTVQGKKDNYFITIPQNFYEKESIGENIDLKFSDKFFNSIITVVKRGPSGLKSTDVKIFKDQSDYEIIKGIEASGLSNLTLINRGFTYINDYPTYFIYYTNGEMYFHSIVQFHKGNIINFSYNCSLSEKDIHLPYIFRVINSLKWKNKF